MDIDISMWKHRFCCALVFVSGLWAGAAAADATVAVASNFLETAAKISERFQSTTQYEVRLTAGSTGQLYAKIVNGAPFDVFLAADADRPQKLIEQGKAEKNTQFTYAVGVLTLYTTDASNTLGPEVLSGPFRTLSMANPKTAPYGAAALQVLDHLELPDRLPGRIAQAQNVTGAFAAVKAGAADLGFVALSSVLSSRNDQPGSRWEPPQAWYDPLRQDAVLLNRGADNPAARDFLTFLKLPETVHLIEASGYKAGVP